AINARLATPMALALDSAGNIYISDNRNNRIRKVTKEGVITTVAGIGTAGFSGDASAATSAQLSNPNGIAFDAKDNLYIADTTNNRVRRVGTDGIITTVAGGGTFFGDGVIATTVPLSSPYGVAVDPAGNLYISAISIRKVTP